MVVRLYVLALQTGDMSTSEDYHQNTSKWALLKLKAWFYLCVLHVFNPDQFVNTVGMNVFYVC